MVSSLGWNLLSDLHPSSRSFKFGDGPSKPSPGVASTPLDIPQKGKSRKPAQCKLPINIVDSGVPCAAARRSLSKLGAQIDFPSNVMTVFREIQIQLISSGSGNVQLPSHPSPPKRRRRNPSAEVYPIVGDLGKEATAEKELKRIHLDLGHWLSSRFGTYYRRLVKLSRGNGHGSISPTHVYR